MLVGVDGSPASKYAVDWAALEAKMRGAQHIPVIIAQQSTPPERRQLLRHNVLRLATPQSAGK
ncbi:universal stress protein [Mycobacterium sp.]|uniref:universal stress protein n=1 Tax=Mycobacterium sp. TaxID=1785 RepID=UPI0031D9A934